MFRNLKNIDTAFRQVRQFTLAVIAACTVICTVALYKSFRLASLMQSRIYILSGGKVLAASAGDRQDNIGIEARDHVKTFHELFFTLDPDDKVIQANIAKALYLADESARQEYQNLSESDYYTGIITANISQRIQVDSIQVDLSSYPYHFRCVAELRIIRSTNTVTRSLVTEGRLRNVQRSDNNSHGFLIEQWHTLENKDLKIENH